MKVANFTFNLKDFFHLHKSEIVLGIIALTLILLPSFLYLVLFSPQKSATIATKKAEQLPQLFSSNTTSLASIEDPKCDAQTIACDPQFKENKDLACGIAKGRALNALLTDDASPCKGMDEAFVEQQLDEACSKGCTAPTVTTIPNPTTQPEPTSPQPTTPADPSNFSLKMNFKVKLPGIGKANFENSAPKNTNIDSTVTITDPQNGTAIKEIGVPLKYSEADAIFEGEFTYSDTVSEKEFTVKLKTPTSLAKKMPDTFQQKGQNQKTAELTLAMGDIVESNEINVQDYNTFITCFKKLSSCSQESTERSDLNDDGKVDIDDLNILQRAFSVGKGDLIGD